ALHCRRSVEDAEALAAELEYERADSTLVLQAELADPHALPALVDTTLARYGRLDALVNNASAFHPTPVASATVTQWNELFASNAQAPFFLPGCHARAARHAWRDREPGGHLRRAPAGGSPDLLHGQGRAGGDDALARARPRARHPRQRRGARCRTVAQRRQALCRPAGAAGTHAAGARRHARRCGRRGALAAA